MINTEAKMAKRHHGRPDLIGEHPCGDAGQLILLLFFLLVWICDSFIFHYSTFLSRVMPLPLRMFIGGFFLLCAGILARKGLATIFGEVREKATLVRKGVFGVVRHPIYLGAILFYVGLTVTTFSIAAGVILLLIISFYYFIARYEEKLLQQNFGWEYEKYKKEVPMLFPKLRKTNS